MLRLRLALGVSTKADVLAVSIGHDAPVTVRSIVDMTSYTSVSVRGALDDLGRAGFVHLVEQKPAAFQAPRVEWKALLRLRFVPDWVEWHSLFAFAAALPARAHAVPGPTVSEYALAVRVRELLRNHDRFPAAENDKQTAQPDDLSAEELAPVIARRMRGLTEWVKKRA
jgi:hypothetical protein